MIFEEKGFLLLYVIPRDNWQMLSGLLVLLLRGIKGSSTARRAASASEVWRESARPADLKVSVILKRSLEGMKLRENWEEVVVRE